MLCVQSLTILQFFVGKTIRLAKYLSFDGIKSYHEFHIKHSLDGTPKLMFRERQYEGLYRNSSAKLKEIISTELSLSPEFYHNQHELSDEKVTICMTDTFQ